MALGVHNALMSESPNLANYEGLAEVFEWNHIYADTDWDAPKEINIAHEICDRHATNRGTIGLFFVGQDGERRRITFWELTKWSNQFANILDDLGLERGDRMFGILPRIPEQYIALLGTLKGGYVYGGINPSYGPERVAYRLEDSEASVVITTPEHRSTIATALEDISTVEDVIVISDDGTGIRRGDVSYFAEMEHASKSYDPVRTEGSDPAFLYYTSGTTDTPKGVVHGHRWIVGIAAAQLYAGDIAQHETDLYWGTGDWGWLTAPVNTLGVWFWGHSLFAYEGEFDPSRWTRFLDEFPITVLSSVPTIYRSLQENDHVLDDVDLDLHSVLSTGAPLEADLVEWGEDVLGVPIHDTYGQAETGNMIINTYPSIEPRPGSMGKPLPGIDAKIIDPDTGDRLEPTETGEIAVRDTFPSFFLGYWENPDLTADAFVDDWYQTGDLGTVDEDGYFYFQGRVDDVILGAGARIGPYPIERALREYQAVEDVAVVPESHPDRSQAVRAVVVLAESADPTDDFRADLLDYAAHTLTEREVPESIEFRDTLPRTEIGRIRRSELSHV